MCSSLTVSYTHLDVYKRQDYRTVLTKKKGYNADVIIESIAGDINTAKIVNARNFCDKEYNGTENYSFELNTNGYELSENEKYNVVVEYVCLLYTSR